MKKLSTILLIAMQQLVVPKSDAQIHEWGAGFDIDVAGFEYDIAYDSLGNVYATGCFQDTIDLDPGPGTALFSASGEYDIYVVKLDPNGNYLWGKAMGGLYNDRGLSINIDPFGNACVTGRFDATVDFDPGAGIYNLSSVGMSDVFVLKLDPNGNFIWAVSMGAPYMTTLWGREEGNAITNDSLGNIYVCGRLEGTADFDPGPGVYNVSTVGGYDIFLMKLDPAGNLIWANNVGSGTSDIGYDVALDGSANVYATGYFGGTADFDPGPGTYNLTASGSDAFVLKLDSAGSFIQAFNFGNNGEGIIADLNENVYVTGTFVGTNDFDPGPGTDTLTSTFGVDVFIAKIDSAGNGVWAKSFEGGGTDYGFDIAIDEFNSVYTTGIFYNTADFDPGPGVYNITSAGSADVFVSKLDAAGNVVWAHGIGSSVGSDQGMAIKVDLNDNIYVGGDYTGAIDVDPGVGIDMLPLASGRNGYVFKWSQCAVLGGTDVQAACDSYTWMDGNTYTSSTNTPTWTLVNQAGCDSVITLDLTITNSNAGTDVITACGTYTWIDGNTYTSSMNTPIWTLTNQAGCDSVVMLNLTINTVDGSATQIDDTTLQANAVGAQYQWLDCDNNYAVLSGETNQTYFATSNGNYAVEVTDNGCVDTSDCKPITTIGIIESDIFSLFVEPNPTQGEIDISLGNSYSRVFLKIYDAAGRVVQEQSRENIFKTNLLIDQPPGLYTLEIIADTKRAVVRIVKQ